MPDYLLLDEDDDEEEESLDDTMMNLGGEGFDDHGGGQSLNRESIHVDYSKLRVDEDQMVASLIPPSSLKMRNVILPGSQKITKKRFTARRCFVRP